MAIPVGSSLALPLTVVWTTQTPPTAQTARLTAFDGHTYEIRLDREAPGVRPEDRVVLDLEDADAPLVHGRIASVDGAALTVRHEGARERDKREFPRVSGGLELRYRVLAPDTHGAALEAWTSAGREPEPRGTWHHPDPFMDVSGSGLAFEDMERCGAGDLLLLRIDLPGRTTPIHGVGRVVRAQVLPDDEWPEDALGIRATHRVAVDVTRMGAAEREALLAHTVELQRRPGEGPARP